MEKEPFMMIVTAEKNKQKILGKKINGRGTKRGAYRKTELKRIWLPSTAIKNSGAPALEFNDKNEVIVRFD